MTYKNLCKHIGRPVMQPETKLSAMVGFRYQADKRDFLVKAYGDKLPDLFRKAADDLILQAVSAKKIKTRKVI